MLKRAFDIVCSSLALLVLWPLLLAIAILIKCRDGGPVFYRGRRIGRFGRPFRVFKFRTMVVDAESIGASVTADDDFRITALGKWLRKYKIDEVPEFINVLTGEMSIVGPRPDVEEYVALFSDSERRILEVRPGLTDWATVWDWDEGAVLAGSPDPERAYMEKLRPEKIRLQMKYVMQQPSLMTDLSIILQTLAALVSRRRPEAAKAVGSMMQRPDRRKAS